MTSTAKYCIELVSISKLLKLLFNISREQQFDKKKILFLMKPVLHRNLILDLSPPLFN